MMRKLDASCQMAHLLSWCLMLLLLEHRLPLVDAFITRHVYLLPPTRSLQYPHRRRVLVRSSFREDETPQNNSCQNKPIPPPSREPDSPDRALSIVSELKSNAALFAAFAYGGLSIPSTLTVSESKVTSVTTSISTARPLPGNDLVQSFVILDTVTLCLMISCVAASQLLIYRLTDGSWYDLDTDLNVVNKVADTTTTATTTTNNSPSSSSAMGRLVTDYGLQFMVARTTFDLGLLTLLLAVAVRAVAIFDVSISVPIVILLGGTCILLAVAYLQSYLNVIQRLEGSRSEHVATTSTNVLVPSFIVVTAIAAFFYPNSQDATSQTADVPDTPKLTMVEQFRSYSSAAGGSKLKSVVNIVAEEKTTRIAGYKEGSGKKASKRKEASNSAPKEAAKLSNRSSKKGDSKEGDDASKVNMRETPAREPKSSEDGGSILEENTSVEAKPSD